jgi:glyoxylate/hydroxypyruvate reductase A
MTAIVYKSDPVRGESWRRLFRAEAPELAFHIWPETAPAADVRYLVAWVPPPDIATQFPNLEIIFSTGAGADQFDLATIPDHVQVVRLVDVELTRSMVEYAVFAVLALHRDIPAYLADQRQGRWHALPIARATQRTVGIMGLGVLGSAIAEALRGFGFRLRGWSASRKHIPDMATFAGRDELAAFLGECEILMCVLPLTRETRGILCAATFAALPRGARLISIGRGGHLVEADLVDALRSGQVDCAILDVLDQEPPPADHPLLADPKVLVTPHIASGAHPESAARRVMELIARHRAGRPLENVIDRRRGY